MFLQDAVHVQLLCCAAGGCRTESRSAPALRALSKGAASPDPAADTSPPCRHVLDVIALATAWAMALVRLGASETLASKPGLQAACD